MRRLLTALALLAASLAFAPAPVKKPAPKAPTIIRYVGAIRPEEDYTLLRFEVSNPNNVPLGYHGYEPDREDKADGIILPLYAAEVSDGKEWKPYRVIHLGEAADSREWKPCRVNLPAGGKGTFNVLLPRGEWKQVKVGVWCYEGNDRDKPGKILWSAPISRDDAKPPRK